MTESLPCPACRKANALPLADPSCKRCGLDLSELSAVRQASLDRRHLALDALRRGEHELALEHAADAWNLQNDNVSARIAGLTCMAQGDFESARSWLAVVS